MAKNIFAKFQDYVKKPKRNVFDLTFRNNLSLKFGQLTPVFCKEVIPGDSFKIHSKFGLELMPMKFPVQTPMNAYLHFFYVRNRNLWKDWQDFIGGTKDGLVMPYVAPTNKKQFYRVGGLADYLGVPNTMYFSETNTDIPLEQYWIRNNNNVVLGGFASVSRTAVFHPNYNNIITYGLGLPAVKSGYPYSSFDNWIATNFNNGQNLVTKEITKTTFWEYKPTDVDSLVTAWRGAGSSYTAWSAPMSLGSVHIGGSFKECRISLFIDRSEYVDRWVNASQVSNGTAVAKCTISNLFAGIPDIINYPLYFCYKDSLNRVRVVSAQKPQFEYVETIDGLDRYDYKLVLFPDFVSDYNDVEILTYQCDLQNTTSTTYECIDGSITGEDAEGTLLASSYLESMIKKTEVYVSLQSENSDYTLVVGDGNLSDTPYDSAIRLNALPFRAYESIYNAYYRNAQNDPFILNGVPEYNRYITNNEGGADITQYDLYNRNWEYDFLTSAVQSPQQGVAPLVGITMTGEATFADENGNTYYAQAILDDNGDITGWQSHSSDMPVGSMRLLMDMANTGISINDLRNVNAFQSFLENNIRRGLKYRDQIMSHFGVKVRYDELDMPEFIGGVSGSMNITKISQTSNFGDTPMGSFVGQGNLLLESKHDITHYCDEHGYIIGVLSVVPVPVYSQLLPKHFTKNAQLDYFFPEFGHVGYQPVEQMLVSPLQTFYNGSDLHKVFGYNRAWFDYLDSVDEVHGQFRTTMRDFVMNRTFEGEPQLNGEFLRVDADDVNDVFSAGTGDDIYLPESDKIIGSMLFKVTAKRPIPLFGIPKLTN